MLIDLNSLLTSVLREADIGGSFESTYKELHLMLLLAIAERLEAIIDDLRPLLEKGYKVL